ncbi:MAG: serine/threonine-protein kinase [Acidobacteriota bacterium]
MDAHRWRRVQEIFHAALEAPEEKRAEVIARSSAGDADLEGEVKALLKAHGQATTFIDRPAFRVEDPADGGSIPEAIGPYRPVKVLGRGGMGVVYLAERADEVFDKRIALKVVNRDLATPELALRFRAERQILADLEHPGIARLLDGGTTDDGRPYLVMEYVDGQPVDRFIAERSLPLEARLELFVRVCRAVQTAHQNLIVHRDLKPGNILVTPEGQPKLLDFGIAKLLTAERRASGEEGEPLAGGGAAPQAAPGLTAPGARLMTPAYASPEQARGAPVTTASDIYSLGVVLFEILTGTRPETIRGPEDGPATVTVSPPSQRLDARAEAEGDPALRRLGRAVRGDLDHIVLAALREDPETRYRSAEALAADIDRFLLGLPIAVRPSTFRYRAGRFLSRHRWPIAAVVLIFAALLSLTVSNILQSRQTASQRDRAEAVSIFMVRLFQNADPRHARGAEITVRELLDEAARELEQNQEPPEVLAALWGTLGEAYLGLGLYQEARGYLTRALEHRRELFGEEHVEVAAAIAALGRLSMAEEDFAGAAELIEHGLEQRRALLGERHVDTAHSLFNLATLHHRQDNLEASERLFRQAIETLEETPEASEMLALAYSGLSALERDRSRYKEAEQLQRRALEVMESLRGSGLDPEVERMRTGLGTLLRRRGHDDEAEAVYRQALAVQRTLYPEGHPDLAVTLSHLSSVAIRQGRYEEADALLEEAVQIRIERLGEDHPLVANALNNRANLAADRDQLEEAEALYSRAMELQEASLPDGHQDLAKTRTNLGSVLAQQGRYQEADRLHRRALAAYRALYGDHHAGVAAVVNNLSQSLKAQGRIAEARAQLEIAVETLRALLGDEHPRLAIGLNNLAGLLVTEGALEPAVEAYSEAIAIANERLGEKHPITLRFLANRLAARLSPSATAQQDLAALEPEARFLLENALAALGSDHRTTAEARGLLGEILGRAGQKEEGEALLRQSLEQLESLPGVPERTLERARARLGRLAGDRS